MTERLRSDSYANANISTKMANDLTPRKTMLILVIVVGCFAVLWPKVFYPMLVGSANQHMKPSSIDKTTGCCDVISETDVNTIKIMSELCSTIIKRDEDTPLTGREIVAKCQSAVLETCGIDISEVLQEQVRLGQSVKQILDEVRSLNGSLCLKYNFGVSPWRLGVPHRVTVKVSPSSSIRQERPIHLRSELVHPAFRERGRAIPQPQPAAPSRPTPRVVEGRPGPIPAMRPTLGGAGHVVPPPKQSTGSMGLIMPIYTIGIVIFFTYTVMKIVFKKQPEALYPPVEPDPHFRREVFESERVQSVPKLTRESVSSKLVVNAMSALLDEVDQEIESRHKASEVADQDVVANGTILNPQEEDQASVKVLGMEMTASCEGGKKWSRPDSPVLPVTPPQRPESAEPPQEIFLEGALPAQSHLLVADSATEAQKTATEEDPAVILAGKMTLSVISLDSSENGTDESSNSGKKQDERSSSNVSEEFEKIEAFEKLEADAQLEDQINEIIEEAQNITSLVRTPEKLSLLEEIENEIKGIDRENIITRFEQDDQPIGVQAVDEQLISEIIETQREKLPSESIQEFIQKEIIANNKVAVEKNATEPAVEEKLVEAEPPKTEITESVVVASDINEKEAKKYTTLVQAFIEDEFTNPLAQLERELISVTKPEVSDQSSAYTVTTRSPEVEVNNVESSPEQPNQQTRVEKETVSDAQLVSETQPENSLDTLASEEKETIAATEEVTSNTDLQQLDEKAKEDQESVAEASTAADVIEQTIDTPEAPSLATTDDTLKEQTSNSIEDNITNEKSRNEQPVDAKITTSVENVDDSQEAHHITGSSVSETIKQAEPAQNVPTESISAAEKESFDKINEAIADLASEFKPRSTEEKERLEAADEVEDVDEDVDIEYEYEGEDSDDEVVDEEIRNVDRLDDLVDQESVEQVNGDDLEQSKYVTTSSATMAENEISDEENFENEDEDDEEVEIQEIIEYVTDDEEELEDEDAAPVERNNINHVNERPGGHN